MLITVDEAIAHCREIDDAETRTYLTGLCQAAEEQVAYQINGDIPTPAPASLKQAALMLVSHWNENRESTTDLNLKGVPMSFQFLCHPYRKEAL